MKRILLTAILVGIVISISMITQSVKADYSKPRANGCFLNATMPQEQRNGTLVSEGAFKCDKNTPYEFLGLPYFKVCGVRVYRNWLGQMREQTIKCSSPRAFSPGYESVRYSCSGAGTYYTELRWTQVSSKDFITYMTLIFAPPTTFVDLGLDALNTMLDGGYINDTGRYRHPTGYVCTH